MNNYDNEKVVNRNWPDVSMRDDRLWHSTWNFQLDQIYINQLDIPVLDDEVSTTLCEIVRDVTKNVKEIFEVKFRLIDKLLIVDTTTTSHLIGSENLKALAELVLFIDNKIGYIKQIQGQDRKDWQLLLSHKEDR